MKYLVTCAEFSHLDLHCVFTDLDLNWFFLHGISVISHGVQGFELSLGSNETMDQYSDCNDLTSCSGSTNCNFEKCVLSHKVQSNYIMQNILVWKLALSLPFQSYIKHSDYHSRLLTMISTTLCDRITSSIFIIFVFDWIFIVFEFCWASYIVAESDGIF